MSQSGHNPLGFNPCFSGCRPATASIFATLVPVTSFNPCFSGCRPATGGALLGGMYRDHKEHKTEKKGKKKQIDAGTGVQDSYHLAVPEEKEIPEARPEGAVEANGTDMVRR